MNSAGPITRSALRTPRAAAIAGIVFSLLLGTSLVLIRLAIPATEQDAATWFSDPIRKNAVLLALNLVPYAGIAFLWFIGVVRDRIGAQEDRFFATVFLGSGLLFVAMLFVSAAMAGGLAANFAAGRGAIVAQSVWQLSQNLTHTLVNIYAMRMAAVFMISTATISLRIGLLPRWLIYLGFACALALLLVSGYVAWFELALPLWVLVVSVHILVSSLRTAHAAPVARPVEQPA